MIPLLQFDEINKLTGAKRRSIPFDQYFDEMELSEKEKKERKEFAKEMQGIITFILILYLQMIKYNDFNKNYIISQLQYKYRELIAKKMQIDKYLEEYIKEFAQETIEVTMQHEEELYYLSSDRVDLISENESNTIFNYKQFQEALKAGKTRKRWITERDERVRKTHAEVDGETIPIESTFLVGNSLMDYPKDCRYGANAEEIVNCRCTIDYT